MNTTRFVALDSWRAVCALLVAIHNLDHTRWIPSFDFVAHSSLFVDFFFVLSGFVITHAYTHKLSNFSEVGAFMLRRIGRLWPLHVTVMTVLIVMSLGMAFIKSAMVKILHLPDVLSSTPTSMRIIVTNLFLVQAFDIPSRGTMNVPSWSISTELWTYFLFSGICLYSQIRGVSSACIIGSCALLSAGALLLLSPNYLATSTDYAFFRCLYGFSFGHLAYRAWRSIPFEVRGAGIAEVLILALVAGFVSMAGNSVVNMVAPLVFGVTVWVFAHQKGYISEILMTRPLVQLGALSYSIYMVHWPVRRLFSRADEIIGPLVGPSGEESGISVDSTWAMCAGLIGYLVVVVILAALTYRWIEQPGRRLFNRMSTKLSVSGGHLHP